MALLFVPTFKILEVWFRIGDFAFMRGVLMEIGGIASLIMDEVIVQAALKRTGVYAVTANLKLRYLTPMKVETDYLCKARIERRGTSSRIKGFAEIIDMDDAVVASAEGTFLLLPES